MNKLLLVSISFLFCSTTLFAQNYCIPERFADSSCFDSKDLAVYANIIFGRAKDWSGNEVAMDMTIFSPATVVDTMKKRPLIVLIHGGAFAQGTKETTFQEAVMLAQRGFVAVAISYRLGWDAGARMNRKWDSSFYNAIYRSVQDSKAALRFLVHNASQYRIDTSWIFLGGGSAGGITALYTSYYKQADWDREFPWLGEDFGGIDTSSNNLTDKYTIKGVLDIWGAISDTSTISMEAARHIALLIFHGTADSVLPYKTSYKPFHFEGGFNIAQRYKHLGGMYQLNTLIKGKHGGDFRELFLTEKICTFCKSLFCGDFKSSESATTYIATEEINNEPLSAIKKAIHQ